MIDPRRHPLYRLAAWLRNEKRLCEAVACAAHCPIVAATARQRAAVCGEVIARLLRVLSDAGHPAPETPGAWATRLAGAIESWRRPGLPAARMLAARFGSEARLRQRVQAAMREVDRLPSEEAVRAALQRSAARALGLHTPAWAATHGGPEC